MIMSEPEEISPAALVYTENLRIFVCHPLGAGSCRCGQNGVNPIFMQITDYIFQPFRLVNAFLRLQGGPGKNPETHHIAACLLEHFNIFFQNIRSVQPLFRIVVTAVKQFLCHKVH